MKPLLKKPVLDGLNEAIGNELYAHTLYLNLANNMQSIGYFGAQKYFLKEAADELTHYQLIVDYINDRGLMASVPAIAKQPEHPQTLRAAFEISLQAEVDLEEFYVDLYEKCEEEESEGGFGDCVTAIFLQKLIKIQRKAIGQLNDLLSRLDRCMDNPAALLSFDQELNGL